MPCLVGANNGASVSTLDPTLSVLGQDESQEGAPASFISNREQPLNGFKYSFLGSAGIFGIQADSSLLQGGLGSADNYLAWTGMPNNYGQSYEGFGVADLFITGWEAFDVNPSGRPNVVGCMWGYNTNLGGGRNNPNEAAFRFGTETHFEDVGSGVPYQFELHLPEFTDQGGTRHRLWSIYPDKSGVIPPQWISESGGIGFSSWNDTTETWCYIQADGGVFRLLNNVVGTGHFPQITLGSLTDSVNGLEYPGPNWDFQIINQVGNVIIGRPSLTRSDNAVLDLVDSVVIGDNATQETLRSLTVNGFFEISNFMDGVQVAEFHQKGSHSTIVDFTNATDEIFQINVADVRVWTDVKLGVGMDTAPTALLHIAAGGTDAGSAPLKLTSSGGVLLDEPEDGTVEYDGTYIYFTIGGTRNKFSLS